VKTWASAPVGKTIEFGVLQFRGRATGMAITIKINLSTVVFDMIVS
jgi:hypothetical protein